ncbi:DUF4143 domain-containing protein [Nocardia vermiculata]|uniref:DUF4143 domain-containing protein n=1 Tax=Nocardia vermiculata TaxID=257274 RepID=A0A846Y1V8_9NOCA|nr:DUF4143 domain-containing protein [Nocardia vermiculata]NKY53233.1 DUF4143 domain-containing protein [Nocardia vermiculata]
MTSAFSSSPIGRILPRHAHSAVHQALLGQRARPAQRQDARIFHYRTRNNVEVDIIIENNRGEVIAIEVKAATTVKGDDFRGLRHLAERLGEDLIAGYVLYTGTETLPFGPKFRAIPVAALWNAHPRGR